MGLTETGYIIRTPQEIQDILVASLKKEVPEFQLQPADIQSNLLNTSICGLMEHENIMAEFFNSLSASGKNISLFKQFAESIGLRQLKEYKSQVVLEFSGPYGAFIPKGTKAKNENGDIFTTQENAVIPTTQKAQVLALGDSENVSVENEINILVSQLTDGISVTNPAPSLAFIPKETDDELIRRVQSRLRSARKGGVDYALSMLKSLQGVDRRLIKFRNLDIETPIESTEPNTSIVRISSGIEAIIGGGDNEKIALLLYLSFLETQKLISKPSGNDDGRTVSLDLIVNNNIIPIKFTRPKLLKMKLTFKPSFSGIITTPTSLEGLLSKKITIYINSLEVGTPLNLISLNNLIVPLLIESGINDYNIKMLSYEIELNDVKVNFDEQTGYLKEIEHDCYLQLVEFGVNIVA